ncbi:MAG: hypothetical protein COA45_09015 [Zetaproteobacteria bacterium]|nr:MAG: hypothetical protein COA45_09015 [Zetaproteobacteria bacterium]
MRTLSLYEVSERFTSFAKTSGASKNSNRNSSALPHDLMHRMSGQNHMKRGLFAMNATHERTSLWFVLGLTYVAYHLYLSQQVMPTATLVQNLSIFFMIGAAFWAGQTYAYSNQASKLLILVGSILLGLTLWIINGATISHIYGALTLSNLISYGNNASPLLAALILYSAIILLYSCSYGLTYSINACIGLILISLLVICGVTFEQTSQNIALWISGWSLFSVFWIRSYSHTRKIYALYQCE